MKDKKQTLVAIVRAKWSASTLLIYAGRKLVGYIMQNYVAGEWVHTVLLTNGGEIFRVSGQVQYDGTSTIDLAKDFATRVLGGDS